MKAMFIVTISLSFCFLTYDFQENHKVYIKNKKSQPQLIKSKSVNNGPVLPNIPKEVMDKILNECQSMDIIPYATSITLSLSDKPSIQKFILRYINNIPVIKELSCTKPNGRIIILDSKANNLIQADIYYSDKCQYLVYFMDGTDKPVYATELTEAGKDYFRRVFSKNAVEDLKKLQAK
jgi:hypothetical protein